MDSAEHQPDMNAEAPMAGWLPRMKSCGQCKDPDAIRGLNVLFDHYVTTFHNGIAALRPALTSGIAEVNAVPCGNGNHPQCPRAIMAMTVLEESARRTGTTAWSSIP